MKIFYFLIVLSAFCNSISATMTTDANFQETTTNEAPDDMSTIESITEAIDENYFGFGTVEETPEVDSNGSLFRLSMTILEDWDDGYMNQTSVKFKSLANDFGTELMDFVDNALQSSESNLTSFNLVLACSFSQHEIFVTFIVSSKAELSLEDLRKAISDRIIVDGRIYDHNTTSNGFVFERINRETANEYRNGNFSCESVLNEALEDHELLEVTSETAGHKPFSGPLKFDDKGPACKSERIQQGSTSIYVFEANQECIDDVRSSIGKGENHQNMPGETTCQELNKDDCTKRSTSDSADDDETVVVVRKRGNKVFIEI